MSARSTLHVACLPMPSPQGTQGLLRVLTESLAAAGHDTTLLTYRHGVGAPLRGVRHRRAAGPSRGSTRSGPSLAKVALDGGMILALRRAVRELRPARVFAHNVEAALVARAARVHATYVAHTRMDAELPTYFARGTGALTLLGRALDAAASRLPTIAIAPDLARHLRVPCVLPPWPVAARASEDEVADARAALPAGPVVLYAGNLDGYQGWEPVAEALSGAPGTWLVATESDPAPLATHPHVRWRLRDEADRRRAHAAAHVVVVPRRAPGGLPIKLLDALARDVPVVATRRALAGLEPRGVVVVESDHASAIRAGIEAALASPPTGGRAWLEENLAPSRTLPRWIERD